MSRGSVPVVTKIKSGMNELVRHGENGFLLPVGDVKSFVEVLAKLSVDSALLLRLRQAAFDCISSGGFTLERAAEDYRKLFESLSAARWQVQRNGPAIIPEHYRLDRRIFKRLKNLAGFA